MIIPPFNSVGYGSDGQLFAMLAVCCYVSFAWFTIPVGLVFATIQLLLPLVGSTDKVMQEAASGCIYNVRRLLLSNQAFRKSHRRH